MSGIKIFLDSLIHKRVTVKTEAGDFHGKLVNYDESHGGFGCLILDSRQGLTLFVRWFAIGR